MKKLMSWLCICMMLFGLSACGTGDEEQDRKAAVESDEGTKSAVETNGDNKSPTGSEGIEKESLEATEGAGNKLLDLKSVMVETIGAQNYYPDTVVEPDQLEEIFGITAEMYDDYLAEVSQDGINVDTLLIIKAKDDKVEAVQEAMFAYRDKKEKAALEDSRNIGKVRASRIETNGKYVSIVQLGGDVTAALTSGEDAVIEQCLQINELVLEVIAQNVY